MPNDKEFELDDLESFSFDDLSLDDVPPGSDAPSAEDPLGVWVKSGPEDLDTAEESAVEIPESPMAAEDLPEEDFLSSEELANLDDSFEFVTVSEEPLEGETTLDDDMAFLDTPEAVEAERSAKVAETESSFNDVSLDDFVSFEDVSSDDETSPASKALGQDSPALLEDEALEEEPFDEEFLDIDIDIEDDINDEELEIVEGAKPRAQASSESKHGSEEVDLSEFVDFEEVSPSQDDLSAAEDLPEVETDDTFFAETNLDDSLPALEDEGAVVLEVDLEPDDHTDMDSLIALEEDLTSGIREPSETDEAPVVLAPVSASPQPAPEPARVEPAPRQEPDLAAQILGKIEQELSSIKQEISELKQEMTHFRSAPQAAPAVSEPREAKVPQEALADEEPLAGEFAPPEGEAEKASHGFFDEEDDETIALTGDELDNILSTAEISEGEEVGLSLDEDLLSLDPEGNLVEPEPEVSADSEEVHVTDEEFLAGTSLDLNEPVVLEDEEAGLGVPESIELEESLPSDLDDSETEDLLADDLFGEPADVRVPVGEGENPSPSGDEKAQSARV